MTYIKQITLPEEMKVKLEGEENVSGLITQLLKEHYQSISGMSIELSELQITEEEINFFINNKELKETNPRTWKESYNQIFNKELKFDEINTIEKRVRTWIERKKEEQEPR